MSKTLKHLLQKLLFAGLFVSNYCFADESSQATQSQAEPAAFLLLVLGLAALFLGMRNLRELRYKRMLPPRPDPRVIEQENESSSASDNSSPSSN